MMLYANYARESVLHPINPSIGTLNVCGLKRRSVYPELCDLVSKCDLFFVTETKLDHTDVISVDGYCFKNKPRQARYIHNSGSISVVINENLRHPVEIIETESDYIFWLKNTETIYKT